MAITHGTAFPRKPLPVIALASAFTILSALPTHANESTNSPGFGIIGTGSPAPTLGIVGTGSPTETLGIVGTGSPAPTLGIVGTGSPAPTLGIVGTGSPTETLGIVGTGSPTETLGIVGTGSPTETLGIVGTGSPAPTLGIVGTGSPSETLGIVGTGSPTPTLGIVGTGSPAETLGIVGTGTLGIVGTGVLGIVGTGNPIAQAEALSRSIGSNAELLALGPVDQVKKGSVLTLGQRIAVNDTQLLSQLSAGDAVAIFGERTENGPAAIRILKIRGGFVEGSTPIYVAGIANGDMKSDGRFALGDMTVEIGAAGNDYRAYDVKAGSQVRVAGQKFGRLIIADFIAK